MGENIHSVPNGTITINGGKKGKKQIVSENKNKGRETRENKEKA